MNKPLRCFYLLFAVTLINSHGIADDDDNSLSADKQWRYECVEGHWPEIHKTSTAQRALDLMGDDRSVPHPNGKEVAAKSGCCCIRPLTRNRRASRSRNWPSTCRKASARPVFGVPTPTGSSSKCVIGLMPIPQFFTFIRPERATKRATVKRLFFSH